MGQQGSCAGQWDATISKCGSISSAKPDATIGSRVVSPRHPMYGLAAVHPEAGRSARRRTKTFVAGRAGREKADAQADFMNAVRSGDFTRMVDGVAAGADLAQRSSRGFSPLMLASMAGGGGALACLRFLLEARAAVEARDEEGLTPLLHACRAGTPDAVELLLELGGASPEACTRSGQTAAMLAVQGEMDTMVPYLLEKRASAERRDREGWSLLLHACDRGRRELVRWLLRRGASASEEGAGGLTPVMLAARHGDLRLGRLLVEKGASLEAVDEHGDSVLMVAIQARQLGFAKWLLEKEVDPMAVNSDGLMAIDLALDAGMAASSFMDTLTRVSGVVIEAEESSEEEAPDDGSDAEEVKEGLFV
mmetsp:Transcript_93930/g.274963  ORF Transcript_93930/g.274963 Transcript_93930/m.274963 type:complete len:365 (-) Transcript_93930:74-1168(-)